ncbi:MAG: hypothetical protein OEW78_05170 [Nitrosopumilus sp.]|uniref:hypothetical protein n=1 Tax=Nitrosopumilus sp. TaxID=2024843 RepID=UPI00246FD741|nr:hypothetical protein [Nitrosopumilus sp.]MDH5431258.1 hypothetical protein [Nitrosopumilus sp.]
MYFLLVFSLLAAIVSIMSSAQVSYAMEEISPTKQVKNGVSLQDIKCNKDLKLIFKNSDNSPACVSNSTAEILIQRETYITKIFNQKIIAGEPKYRILSWHDVPEEQEEFIVRMIWIDENSDPIKMAKKSNEKPEGYAAVFAWKFTRGLYSDADDRCIDSTTREYTKFQCPWLDNGIISIKEKTAEWFGKYKDAGGVLDYLILDDESSFGNWSLQANPGWADAIENDPRFSTLIPKLNQTSLDLVMNRPHANHSAYIQWNAIQDEMLVDARNKAIFEPVKKLYPNVKASNYNDYVVDMDHVIPEKNGHKQYYFSNFGTHNAKSFYGDIRQYGDKIGHDSNTVLEWQIKIFEAIKNSSDIPNMAWIPYFSYPENDLNQEDYEEMMVYLICHTKEPLLFWNSNASDLDNKLAYDIMVKINNHDHCK